MQTSQKFRISPGVHGFYHQAEAIDPYGLSQIQILHNNSYSDVASQESNGSFQTVKEEYFTLDSSTTTTTGGLMVYDSPVPSVSSNRIPFSPQGSHSCHYSPDGSPLSGSSHDDENLLMRQKLKELEFLLLESEPDFIGNTDFCFHQADQLSSWDWSQMGGMIPRLDVKQMLLACAQAISDGDVPRAAGLMQVLEQMVSVSGEPIQRLGAYMLEGLRARVELSGSKIYRALKCDAPVSSDLMTYMGVLFNICPYWKFAYVSSNEIIQEAIEFEPRIHIIDFQIAQGTQWMYLLKALANRPGGPPVVRITGVDDSQSAKARGGGLHIVGQKLSGFARSVNIPFQFHDAAMTGSEVQLEHLALRAGEAVVVNFPYVLHHMPDESVSTWNHRDRLLRLVKSLSPKLVTLVEQESNTNTNPFLPRFRETLDYYKAMFESIDAGSSRDDRQRINAEQHCVARDIVNMIACEGPDRVERHELLGKWRMRFGMAGFVQCKVSCRVTGAVRGLLKEYDGNYGVEEKDGALYLRWMNRAMSTSSAWR